MNLFLLSMLACSPTQPEPLFLTKEFYNWQCDDYEDLSNITISTNTCEDQQSGLYWIVAESRIAYGGVYKKKLDKSENWDIDCLYQTEIPLIENYCIEIEGVTLTAYVEDSSWSGMFLEN